MNTASLMLITTGLSVLIGNVLGEILSPRPPVAWWTALCLVCGAALILSGVALEVWP